MPSSTRSLHSLSVQNPKFQAHPLFWTSYHTSIVGCVFQQVEDDNPTAPRTLMYDPFSDTADDAKRLATDFGPREKLAWLKSMFKRPRSPITETWDLPYFSYCNREVKHTCVDLSVFRIKKEQVEDHGDPIIGYYPYTASKERRNSLTPKRAPRGLNNNPVKRLYEIRYRRITPPKWREDPYLFCLILSLAQIHRRWDTVPLAGDIQTRLLVTERYDSNYAYVYKADIPRQLLGCLDNPTRTLDDFAFPTIAWVRVPFRPYTTFAERIQSHLVCPGSKPIPTNLQKHE